MSAASLDSGTLARADLLLLLAELLTAPATARRWYPACGGDLDELIGRSGIASAPAAADALSGALAAFARDPDAHTADLGRLFDGPQLCPPNETAYVRRDKGAILGDIAGFYRAFGFEPSPTAGEKADHIATELQFCALLLVMLARAEAEGDPERGDITRDALQSFSRDHLGEWIGGFADALAASGGRDGWRALAHSLRHSWTVLADELGLAPGTTTPDPLVDELPPDGCDGCPSR